MAELARGPLRLWLSEFPEDGVVGSALLWLCLDDADEFGESLGTGFDEDNVFEVRDPDGNRLRICNA
jgi:hypothetical protein